MGISILERELAQGEYTYHSTPFVSIPWNKRSSGQGIICTATGEERAGKRIGVLVL